MTTDKIIKNNPLTHSLISVQCKQIVLNVSIAVVHCIFAMQLKKIDIIPAALQYDTHFCSSVFVYAQCFLCCSHRHTYGTLCVYDVYTVYYVGVRICLLLWTHSLKRPSKFQATSKLYAQTDRTISWVVISYRIGLNKEILYQPNDRLNRKSVTSKNYFARIEVIRR